MLPHDTKMGGGKEQTSKSAPKCWEIEGRGGKGWKCLGEERWELQGRGKCCHLGVKARAAKCKRAPLPGETRIFTATDFLPQSHIHMSPALFLCPHDPRLSLKVMARVEGRLLFFSAELQTSSNEFAHGMRKFSCLLS